MTNKNFKFLIVLILAGAILSFASFALISQASPNEHSQKPNIHKPVPATDVEIIKKITIKGQPAGAKAARVTQATTGILGPTTAGNKYAIVIGISDYPGTANDLKYADDDAEEMITALTTLYGFSDTNITEFIDKEGTETSGGTLVATREAVLTAIENIPSNAGEIVFFFSGHGMRGIADDGDKERIDESIVAHDGTKIVPIWDGELKDAFSKFATSRIIFIFDSCVAGGMTDLNAPGRIINMATTENGTAYEGIYGSEEGNGQFTYYFVDRGMLKGEADVYNHDSDTLLGEGDDVVVEEAFDYAKANSEYQTPTISDFFDNDLLL